MSPREANQSFLDFKKYKIFQDDQPQPLFYKLKRLQQLLKSMYDECKYCVKTNKHRSTLPTLSHLPVVSIMKQFTSDAGKHLPERHEIFDDLFTPVKLVDMALSLISSANDLVLLSQSADDLQRALDKLDDYCFKNNRKREKIMHNIWGNRV